MNNEKYKNELLNYYGKENIIDLKIKEIRRIIKESGAYKHDNNLMNKYYDDEAINFVKNNNWIKEEDKSIIYRFIEYLRKREKLI